MASELTLKLLVDNTAHRVLFAEAGKEVVDFLLALLTFPVSYVIELLTNNRMAGSIANLYDSLKALDETYLQSKNSKSLVLPKTSTSGFPTGLLLSGFPTGLLLSGSSSSATKRFFRCSNYYGYSNCHNNYSDVSGTLCPSCKQQMTTEMVYVRGDQVKVEEANYTEGFVKGVVTYTIMDDLSVTPMSTISSITLLNRFKVRELGALEERTVTLGREEGLDLLRASLQSKTVLTDVFLSAKKKVNRV